MRLHVRVAVVLDAYPRADDGEIASKEGAGRYALGPSRPGGTAS
ncbi:hypothetical protein ACTWP5_17525 [Streptomyces sp. 4N509B]